MYEKLGFATQNSCNVDTETSNQLVVVLEAVRVHWKNLSKCVNMLRGKIQLLNVAGGGTYCYH